MSYSINKILSSILRGVRYFIFQMLLEIVLMVILAKMGFSFLLLDAHESLLTEIISGIVLYYSLPKIVYYLWVYILAFIIAEAASNTKSSTHWGVTNWSLNVCYLLIVVIAGKTLQYMIIPMVASISAATLIVVIIMLRRSNGSNRESRADSNVEKSI